MCFPVFLCIRYPLVLFEPSLTNPLPNWFKYRTLPKPVATAPDGPSAKTAAPFPLRCRPSLMYISSFPTNPRIPLPLPCKAASPSHWLPSASNFCILVSCFQTLVKFPIRWSVQPLDRFFDYSIKIPDKMICPTLGQILWLFYQCDRIIKLQKKQLGLYQ